MGDGLNEIVEAHIRDLREHFEVVLIVASLELEDGGTRMVSRGAGNWYARRGMAEAFLRRDAAEELATDISDKFDPPQGEDWRKE